MIPPIANPLPKLRVAMLLPGLGRVQRGAETAFLELSRALQAFPDVSVELFGSGTDFSEGLTGHDAKCLPREVFERWPHLPVLRNEYCYEELSFVLSLISRRTFKPRQFDVALHTSFPFVNWYLRRLQRRGGPKSIFVTQNGDWPCRQLSREYRTFRCDGLVCTNPEYFARHGDRYRSALIPNGVDPQVFKPREECTDFRRDPRLPADKRIVLMVSALMPYKRVEEGIRAIARVPDAFLLLAGDGPDRQAVQALAARELPGRHLLLGSVHRNRMPDLYRQADVFLHMSKDEPFGIVYLEAAASGLAVVAHEAPITQWILGNTALLVDTTNAAAVAQALKLGTMPGSSLGSAARYGVLSEWTWAAQAAKYRNFFLSCTARKGVEASCSRSSSSVTTPATSFEPASHRWPALSPILR